MHITRFYGGSLRDEIREPLHDTITIPLTPLTVLHQDADSIFIEKPIIDQSSLTKAFSAAAIPILPLGWIINRRNKLKNLKPKK